MNDKKKKFDPVVLLLDIFIIVMVIGMIPVGYNFFFYKSRAKNFMNYTQDASKLSFDLGQNDYASLIRARYMNSFNGIENTSYDALADYVEALSHYKVYNEKGYTDRAGEQMEIMQQSRGEMGELTVFADKVDKMFDME